MDKAFVLMMKEFIDVSIKDRKENSDSLMDIKLQLTKLETHASLNFKTNEERYKENNGQHEKIEKKLEKIPTDNDKTTYEKRLDDLEKLKPMVWKMTGGLVVVSVLGVAVAKQIGWL